MRLPITESEWLDCTDPLRMLRFLGAEPNARKTLLLTCACLRRVVPSLDDVRHWIAIAEDVADGRADVGTLPDERCESALGDIAERCVGHAALDLFICGWQLGDGDLEDGTLEQGDEAWAAERQAQAVLVRDVFGDRGHAAAFDPAWRTAIVLALAGGIYDSRRHADLPILADALEEAGCTRTDVLTHCRTLGEHVRGCWALDLALGRE